VASDEITLRSRVEGFSRPLLVRLTALPRPAVLVGTLVLVVVGLLAPLVVALPALILLLVFVGWIGYLSWPAVSTGGKLARLLMPALIVTMIVLRL
jgi:hypothetical protein